MLMDDEIRAGLVKYCRRFVTLGFGVKLVARRGLKRQGWVQRRIQVALHQKKEPF